MSGSTLIAMPNTGEMALWRLVAAQPRTSRAPLRRSVMAFGLGLGLTSAAVAATWTAMRPDTVVQTRILTDGDAARPALSDLALRFVGAPGQPVSLQEGGRALLVSVRDHDPALAAQRSRALVDAILDAPLAVPVTDATPNLVDPAVGLRAQRDRIVAAMAAVDAQGAAGSASLTTLARDIAAASRPADQKPGHEALDKGNAALADLQLQRVAGGRTWTGTVGNIAGDRSRPLSEAEVLAKFLAYAGPVVGEGRAVRVAGRVLHGSLDGPLSLAA